MNNELKNNGFSLTEVLLAVGTFAIGMIFVAGVFPVAIRFTTIATERTIAAVVTDEAFAKIRLYGVDFNSPLWPTPPPTACVDFNDVSSVPLNRDEFAYPSTPTDPANKQYFWSALCRLDPNDPTGRSVQVTVFVSRKTGSGPIPVPRQVGVSGTFGSDVLQIIGEKTFINDGYTIVDDRTGDIYRVLERYRGDEDNIIELDKDWQGGDLVWVVPPPATGGRYPCIAIYQKVIRF